MDGVTEIAVDEGTGEPVEVPVEVPVVVPVVVPVDGGADVAEVGAEVGAEAGAEVGGGFMQVSGRKKQSQGAWDCFSFIRGHVGPAGQGTTRPFVMTTKGKTPIVAVVHRGMKVEGVGPQLAALSLNNEALRFDWDERRVILFVCRRPQEERAPSLPGGGVHPHLPARPKTSLCFPLTKAQQKEAFEMLRNSKERIEEYFSPKEDGKPPAAPPPPPVPSVAPSASLPTLDMSLVPSVGLPAMAPVTGFVAEEGGTGRDAVALVTRLAAELAATERKLAATERKLVDAVVAEREVAKRKLDATEAELDATKAKLAAAKREVAEAKVGEAKVAETELDLDGCIQFIRGLYKDDEKKAAFVDAFQELIQK